MTGSGARQGRPPLELLSATFVARPNRFIVRAALDDGRVVDSHLADPGRLIELLTPGAKLRLRPAAKPSARRTGYSVVLVRAPSGVWVCLETGRANRLAESLLTAGEVRGVGRGWSLRGEVTCGSSRFDFLLERPERRCWVEVKSVTLVEDGLGLFPDAPTERGRRHVRELTELTRSGDAALVLFVAQRSDARRIRPHHEIDPGFAQALSDARKAGVMLRAARFALTGNACARHLGPVPVQL